MVVWQKKRPHDKGHKDGSKKLQQSRSELSKNSSGSDLPGKVSRQNTSSGAGSGGGGGRDVPSAPIIAPAVVTIDPNSSDHVVAMTELKERIASLERKLAMKDKDLLEKDKQVSCVIEVR